AASTAGRTRARGVPGNEVDGESPLRAVELFPGRDRTGQAQRLEMPRGLALHVRGRGWAGALLLAAARLSRQTSGRVQRGRSASRVSDGEVLRAVLHRELRALRVVLRLLAWQADSSPGSSRARASDKDPRRRGVTLAGKVAIVTGSGGGGTGRAAALRFAREG